MSENVEDDEHKLKQKTAAAFLSPDIVAEALLTQGFAEETIQAVLGQARTTAATSSSAATSPPRSARGGSSSSSSNDASKKVIHLGTKAFNYMDTYKELTEKKSISKDIG